MAKVCLQVISALGSHIAPRAYMAIQCQGVPLGHMAEMCLYLILALDSHIGPRADMATHGPYDLEAHLGHIITCTYVRRKKV